MQIDATIQARMGSSRLPGKVLKQILGKPLLQIQIERLQQCRLIDRIIVATSTAPADDAIVELTEHIGVPVFRGSEDDVLGRVLGALQHYHVDIHAEFQGDNPIPDPLLVDSILGFYLKNTEQYDYVSNGLRTTYPPGFEVSVYPSRILERAEQLCTDTSLREHVGIHVYQRPEEFRVHNVEAPDWHCEPNLHVEVDTAEDFTVVKRIVEHFYPHNPGFGINQVIQFAREHNLLAVNQHIERRWEEFRDNNAS